MIWESEVLLMKCIDLKVIFSGTGDKGLQQLHLIFGVQSGLEAECHDRDFAFF